MNKLKKNGNNYSITHKKSYIPLETFSTDILSEVFEFAYRMTFGKGGEHRHYRSGGQYNRKNGEIFINTFQGKLSEFGIYNYLKKSGFNDLNQPDLETWSLGQWDDTDLQLDDKKISIKSTKFYGNLILLETKDWDKEGTYLPNDSKYDLTILVRIKPDSEKIMKSARLLYSNSCEKERLRALILKENWSYDIPGFISIDMLKTIIENEHILPQNSLLNQFTKMDAENYYIQAGDLLPLSSINSYI